MAESPWRFMSFWAAQRQRLTREFEGLLAAQPTAPLHGLSWGKLGDERTLQVGNALKALYLSLRTAHLRGEVHLALADTVNEGFMGILSVRLPAASRALFDAGLFPTPASAGGASCFPFARNTLRKLWQSAGLVEYHPPVREAGDVFYRFDEALRARMRDQIDRAEVLRFQRAHKRARTGADAETQTEPDECVTHAETLLVAALSLLSRHVGAAT